MVCLTLHSGGKVYVSAQHVMTVFERDGKTYVTMRETETFPVLESPRDVARWVAEVLYGDH